MEGRPSVREGGIGLGAKHSWLAECKFFQVCGRHLVVATDMSRQIEAPRDGFFLFLFFWGEGDSLISTSHRVPVLCHRAHVGKAKHDLQCLLHQAGSCEDLSEASQSRDTLRIQLKGESES